MALNEQKPDRPGEIMACLLALGVSNLRPTIIGETQSLPVCAALVAIEAALLIHMLHIGAALRYRDASLSQIALYGALTVYLVARNSLDPTMNNVDTWKAFGISSAYFGAIAITLSNGRYARIFFDTFAIVIIASCVSNLTSLALVIAGVRASSLAIVAPPIPRTYSGMEGAFQFPFSFANNEAPSWFGTVPRFAGIFREVGCLPPFACWAAAYAVARGWSILWSIVCLLASVLCLSTIGPIALYTAAILFLHRAKIPPGRAALLVIAAGILLWPVLYAMDFIGLEDKLNSRAGSYEDREALTWAVLDTKNWIFGDGGGWSEVSSNAGINLISQIRVSGVISFAMIVAIYVLPIRNFRFWSAACVPAIVSVLFSQPITADPCFLMIFLSGVAAEPSRSLAARTRNRGLVRFDPWIAEVRGGAYARDFGNPIERAP